MALWTVALQAPLPMEFFRQEYWSGLPFPSGDRPNPGIKPGSPALEADSLPSEPPGKPYISVYICHTHIYIHIEREKEREKEIYWHTVDNITILSNIFFLF